MLWWNRHSRSACHNWEWLFPPVLLVDSFMASGSFWHCSVCIWILEREPLRALELSSSLPCWPPTGLITWVLLVLFSCLSALLQPREIAGLCLGSLPVPWPGNFHLQEAQFVFYPSPQRSLPSLPDVPLETGCRMLAGLLVVLSRKLYIQPLILLHFGQKKKSYQTPKSK